MEDAPLYRLQSVHDVRHGTLQYHVTGVVQKPVLVHAAKVMGYTVSFLYFVHMNAIYHKVNEKFRVWGALL